MTKDLRYPIGQFEPKPYTDQQRVRWIADIRFLPQVLENAIVGLDEYQLQTPYRDGGWTVQQVVHHVADSHINAYTRFKLCLTEDNPVIKPYEEGLWAGLADVQLPVNISVTLLHALHARWVAVIESVRVEDWNRTVVHPARQAQLKLWDLLGSYSWHGLHHTAHIMGLRERMNW